MKCDIALLTLGLTATGVPAQGDPPTWNLDWNSGAGVESSDGDIKIKMGGRIMHDWPFADADNELGDIEDGSEFRRADQRMRTNTPSWAD